MTRVHIAAGVVEVEAAGAKAEALAVIAAGLWHQTQECPPPRSNWLICGPGGDGEPVLHTAGPYTYDDGTTE